MFCNPISKRSYTKLNESNEKCENDTCLDCLIEELKKDNWHKSSDHDLLKIAYEKKIIQNNATSITELNREDRKIVKQILGLCNLSDYNL